MSSYKKRRLVVSLVSVTAALTGAAVLFKALMDLYKHRTTKRG